MSDATNEDATAQEPSRRPWMFNAESGRRAAAKSAQTRYSVTAEGGDFPRVRRNSRRWISITSSRERK